MRTYLLPNLNNLMLIRNRASISTHGPIVHLTPLDCP
jgi:hypothetical protein